MSSATDEFRAARDFLLAHRTDYVTAYAKFRWPRPERFNFAIDWFDTVLAAERPNHSALRIIEADGTDESYSFGALSERSDQVAGWLRYSDSFDSLEPFEPDEHTMADEPLLLYFTSGTTALPKLVEHTHASYPIGHLSTMYWIGLQQGDVHLNVSSPGWAKHAWSCVFAPWIAGATICLFNYDRFDAAAMLDVLRDARVTTFCAPPTVWRMLIQQDLAAWKDSLSLREVVGAGEPLNPEVIEAVQRAWGLTIRDGFGQTESSLQVGNSPGQELKLGSMGRPMPGFSITLVDPLTGEPADEGEICVDMSPARPVGLMVGYRSSGEHPDHERNEAAFVGGRYHTGDVATID